MTKAIAVNLPRLALTLAVGLNVCGVASAVWASPSQPSPSRRCLVEVEVLGGSDPVLLSTLREVVGRYQLVIRPASAQGDAARSTPDCGSFARVSVELREDQVQVEVIDTVDGKLSTRRTLRRDPSPNIMREEVALVVRSAIDALIERDHATPKPPREDARPAAKPPAPEPPVAQRSDAEPSTWSWGAGMFGFGRTFATETKFATGFGGLTSFSPGDSGWRPTVWLMGGYQVATTTSRDGVDVKVSAGSFRLLPTVSLYRASWLALDAGAGLGIDVLAVSMSSTVPEAHTHPDRTDVIPLGSLLMAARIPIGGGSSLLLGGTGDLDVAPNRYMVARGGTAQPALALHAFRIGGLFGISYRLAGGGEP